MRDYKQTTSRPRPRQGTSRRQPPARSVASAAPAAPWLWLAAGLSAGLLIAFLLYLSGHDKKEPRPDLRLNEKTLEPKLSDRSTRASTKEAVPVTPPVPDKDVQAVLDQPLPPPDLKAADDSNTGKHSMQAKLKEKFGLKTVSTPDEPSHPKNSAKKTSSAKTPAPDTAQPQYEFYDLLPHMEVEVPADALDTSPAPRDLFPENGQATADKNNAVEGAAPQGNGTNASGAQASQGTRFILQAGAFKNPREAENLSAKLMAQNLESNVSVADVPGQGKLYRVRLGPYSKAEDARHALARAQTLVPKIVLMKQQ